MKSVKNWILRGNKKYFIIFFLVTRLTLTVIGFLAFTHFDASQVYELPFHREITNPWIRMWAGGDTRWYLHLAQNWYPADGLMSESMYGFFPLYPLLIRVLNVIVYDPFVSGLIISNVFLVVAAYYMYRLVEMDHGKNTASRSIRYLILFPSAFIFSTALSESLFLALLVSAFYYARKRMWKRVGVLGFLLALTRGPGVLAAIPLTYEYVKSEKDREKIFYLAFIPLGFLTFMAHNHVVAADALASFNSKTGFWKYRFTDPLSTILKGLTQAFAENATASDTILFFNTLVIVLTLAAIILSHDRMRYSYWLLSLLLVTAPLMSGVASMHGTLRFILVIFPLYIVFSKWGEKKIYDRVLSLFFIVSQASLMVFWSLGVPVII